MIQAAKDRATRLVAYGEKWWDGVACRRCVNRNDLDRCPTDCEGGAVSLERVIVQAKGALIGVMICAVLLGVGDLTRQAHHRNAGKGTVLDGYWTEPVLLEIG